MRGVLLKYSGGKTVILLFFVTNLVYVFMLKVTIPMILKHAEGFDLLDMMPMGYNLDYVEQLFNTLGQQGREAYLFYQLPLDIVYPFLFVWCYSVLFAYVLRKLNKFESRLLYFCWLPVLVGIADYAENIGIVNLLLVYPELSNRAVVMANMFTLMKSATTTLYFVGLLVIFMWWSVKTLSCQIHYR